MNIISDHNNIVPIRIHLCSSDKQSKDFISIIRSTCKILIFSLWYYIGFNFLNHIIM